VTSHNRVDSPAGDSAADRRKSAHRTAEKLSESSETHVTRSTPEGHTGFRDKNLRTPRTSRPAARFRGSGDHRRPRHGGRCPKYRRLAAPGTPTVHGLENVSTRKPRGRLRGPSARISHLPRRLPATFHRLRPEQAEWPSPSPTRQGQPRTSDCGNHRRVRGGASRANRTEAHVGPAVGTATSARSPELYPKDNCP